MTYPIDQLQKVAEAHRSRANMTKLSALLEDLEEINERLQPWLEKAAELSDALNAFADATEQLVDGILPDGAQNKILDAVDELLRYAPDSSSNLAQLAEFHEAAKDRLSDLDDSMEDRSYTAEDRDTMWYEAADQAGNLAVALEELGLLGTAPEEGQPDTECST